MTLCEPNGTLAPRKDQEAHRPRLSVVIPAYNESAFLGDCLSSLARQDFTGGYEVIVVDNNSTDGTAEIARAHGATVAREERPGVCWARQAGTLLASGDIVVSTDADTVFDPGWLSRIERAFRENVSRVAVAGPCHFVGAPLWGRLYTRLLFGIVHLVNRAAGRTLYVTATNIAFRKSAWTGYDTRATQGGDELDLLRRLRTRGEVAFDLGNPTYTSSRRLHKGFVYNVFVTFFFYYFMAYQLNRILGRPLVGMAPPFRAKARPAKSGQRLEKLLIAGVCVALAVILGGLTAHFVDR